MSAAPAWTGLALSAVGFHLTLLLTTQASVATILFLALIWAAAALALDEPLSRVTRSHSRRAFVFCALGFLIVLARGVLVQTSGDPYLVLAPFALGLTLAGLDAAPRPAGAVRDALLVLALAPLLLIGPVLLPVQPLSSVSAAMAGLLLNLFGAPAIHQGPVVGIAEHAVRVAGACAGAELITQALLIGLLALVLVPLPRRWQRWPLLLLAPLCGWLANVLRITLLVLLTAAQPQAAADDTGWFGFFHSGSGGLLFSALGISVYGLIYSRALEHGLRRPAA